MKTSAMRPPPSRGFSLFTCLILLALLSVFAGLILRVVLPEIAGAHYQTRERRAFYHAEAGVGFVIDQINADLMAGTLALTGETVNVTYQPPAAYPCEPVRLLTQLGNPRWYTFTVTGRQHNARAAIEISITRPRLLRNLGVFGDASVALQPNVELFSYHSSRLLNPTSADSTGEANVGSNEQITFRPGAFLDGLVLLGADVFGNEPAAPAGYEAESLGRISPDPLGATVGPLADAFAFYSQPANNDNVAAGITGDKISCSPGSTLTLPGGRYYLTDVYLAGNSTLVLDATPENPVIIYLDGPLRTQPNHIVNSVAGRPSNFFIFSRSSDEIRIQPNGDFRAFVYAPLAEIRLAPNNDLYGVFWGRDSLLLPGNVTYIDVDLLDSFLAPRVEIVQWRQIIN
ncbi:MAG: hypothetical protein K9N49_10380 [Candidatus Marinimicrobia bacterium]|nr:hypothetical protein [Candidatus Neomarinimicrobiota bacterium]